MTKNFDDAVEACTDRNAPFVRQWILDGNDVNFVDEYGRTIIFYAVSSGSAEIVQDLIDAGAQVDFQDPYGNTPLWRAVFDLRGGGDVIKVLLAAGANPDLENKSGVSPRSLTTNIADFELPGIFN